MTKNTILAPLSEKEQRRLAENNKRKAFMEWAEREWRLIFSAIEPPDRFINCAGCDRAWQRSVKLHLRR